MTEWGEGVRDRTYNLSQRLENRLYRMNKCTGWTKK